MPSAKPILVAVAVALAAAPLLGRPASADDKVVNVYNWSDYIDPAILQDFTKETGIKVVYDTMDSNEVLETKLLAGNTGYDIVVPTGSFLQRQIRAGVFLPLDKSKLSHYAGAWPDVYRKLEVYDPGNAYAVNYFWGTTGIGYNVDKAKQRLGGDGIIDSWDVVFKPELLSKFKDCSIEVLDTPEELFPAALNYLGLDPDSKSPADIEKAAALWETLRPFIAKFHSSDYINGLANGDICLVVGWSGDVLQARSRAGEAHAKSPDKPAVTIAYVIPKEGAHIWFDNLAIPKDAAHVEAAYAFIDYLMRPEVAARNSNFVSYANGIVTSQKLIEPAILGNPAIYPTAGIMAKLFPVTAYDAKIQRVITRAYTRVKTGQ
jgi:putrescine transport system substrate-binding protein